MLVAMSANIFLLLLMNFAHMSVEGIFGTEDELAFDAMKLPRSFVNLFDVLPQCFGIKIDFPASITGFFQWLGFGVNSILVLDEAVVSFEPFGTMPAKEWQGVVSFTTMLNDFFGTDSLGTAIRTIIDAVLRIAMERNIVP